MKRRYRIIYHRPDDNMVQGEVQTVQEKLPDHDKIMEILDAAIPNRTRGGWYEMTTMGGHHDD